MTDFTNTPGQKDTFVGPGSWDIVSYSNTDKPVKVTLRGAEEATVYVNGVAEDTLRNIEGVEGGYGHDELTGDDKDNWLLGGDENDTLNGGPGNDTLSGGVGADRFVYGSAAETVGDVITDFKAGEDLIDLSEVGRFALLGDSPQAKSLWTVRDGKDLLLRGDTDGDATTAEVDLRLKNVASLGAADIKFQLDPVVSVTDVITETEAVPVAEAVQGLVIDLGQQPEVADASGNAGDDTLNGGPGNDTLTGGEGRDIFAYDTAKDTVGDVITDFTPGSDTLDLSQIGGLAFSEGPMRCGRSATSTETCSSWATSTATQKPRRSA